MSTKYNEDFKKEVVDAYIKSAKLSLLFLFEGHHTVPVRFLHWQVLYLPVLPSSLRLPVFLLFHQQPQQAVYVSVPEVPYCLDLVLAVYSHL